MTTQPILLAEKLEKVFPGVRALGGVNLTMAPGSVHALLGENGAGKSTMIKIITGVYRPDGGSLTLNGVERHFKSPHDAVIAGIGVVHQERNVVPEFSVAENMLLHQLPAKAGLVDREAMREQARRALDMIGLDVDLDEPVKGLSVAQTQLVEIAKALTTTDSKVLLLDEPTSALTLAETDRLLDVMRKLRDNGTSLLLVSHKLEEVFAIADTVTVLRDGESVLEAAPLGRFTTGEIVDLMVGRSHKASDFPARSVDRAQAPVLELDALSTGFGHRDVSLDVRRGEIVGLYGLVGAGRTELAKAVLGLDRIVGGGIRVAGKDVKIDNVGTALGRHHIGYVPENRKTEGLFLDQPLTMNIAVTVWARIRNFFGYVAKRRERDIAEHYVDRLGIKAAPRQFAGQLSGGNQQKVSLAKWLAADCEILIIDEPTVGIDVRTKAAFHELIWDLAADGMAILLITSDLPEMVTLADRIVVMRDSRVMGTVENSHHYGETSKAVIGLVHQTV
ncbi:MAG TPA: sugar ABC transporter ATP-binding protein [Actinokineospora sp.]|jgi:ribose transport system ATP-binding protein|nr:sugar ABC transporter ATP-binding protein [Actinokineospora sp.]